MNAQAKLSMAQLQHALRPDMPSGEDDSSVGQLQHARLIAQLIYSQRQGRGCLPFCLGLLPLNFVWLLHRCFPDELAPARLIDSNRPENQLGLEKGSTRQELLAMRQDEWLEVRGLLLASRAGTSEFEIPLADIVAAGCLGGDHLWRDLGLKSRMELSELMSCHFPDLAQRNSGDMKWKKFFYKQLCEQEGGYVCRAPSCDQCAAYDDCFGPEE